MSQVPYTTDPPTDPIRVRAAYQKARKSYQAVRVSGCCCLAPLAALATLVALTTFSAVRLGLAVAALVVLISIWVVLWVRTTRALGKLRAIRRRVDPEPWTRTYRTYLGRSAVDRYAADSRLMLASGWVEATHLGASHQGSTNTVVATWIRPQPPTGPWSRETAEPDVQCRWCRGRNSSRATICTTCGAPLAAPNPST
jgi:hypothetical protein